MTGGYGCDIYIEATGHPSSVQQGLDCIRKLGRFVEFSVFGEKVSVDWSIISDRKELDLLGVHLSPYCYDTVIEWIDNGKLPTAGVVSHKFPLEKWEEGFHLAQTGEDGAMKVVLDEKTSHPSMRNRGLELSSPSETLRRCPARAIL